MADGLRILVEPWLRRSARPDPAALAAVAGLTPATVVTGGSRGIGLALARRFAEAGDTLVLVARTAVPLEAAADAIGRECKVKAVPLVLDVTTPGAPAAIDRCLAENGLYLDRLVNNAGAGLAGPFHAMSAEDIDRLIALNVAALTRLMRHAIAPMRARGRGGILNVSSLGGLAPGPYQSAYYASKAFVISLTEAVAYEVRGEGVRVAVVAPGPVETSFHAGMGAESSLYRSLLPAQTPAAVARSAYRGFMLGRRVIVPGLLPTLGSLALRFLPHAIVVPVVGTLLFTNPRKAA
jgi:short-subunit dehydrogenase